MPIFEYTCKACDHRFEALVLGTKKPQCPKCESKGLSQQLSVFAVAARSTSGPSLPSGGCGTCGDPRGPGSCSIPDTD
jgi:putative FmdB family regulatory protein